MVILIIFQPMINFFNSSKLCTINPHSLILTPVLPHPLTPSPHSGEGEIKNKYFWLKPSPF